MPCFLAPCVLRLLYGDCHTALCMSSVQELLALSELAHYHLVRLYGISANGSISIISEFVPGGPLDGYLQDNAAFVSGGDMLSYAVQVAKVGVVGSWVGQGEKVDRSLYICCGECSATHKPFSNCLFDLLD